MDGGIVADKGMAMDEVIKLASTNCICDPCQFGEVSYSGGNSATGQCLVLQTTAGVTQVSHAVMSHDLLVCVHVCVCAWTHAHMHVRMWFHSPRRLQDTAWWKSRTTEARLEYRPTPLVAF